MAKEITVGFETEMRKYRLEMGVRIQEVCKELLIPAGLYSAHECGNREYSGERKEEFKQDTIDAINKIVMLRREAMYDLELNMCEDDEEDGLIWQCLTTDIYKQAVELLASGKNIVQTCILLEIDSVELTHRLTKDEIDYQNVREEDYNHLFND
ncbi:hypothetical protein [Bacillus thuringiensis]|uniref:hypothetical protein n=1 Tax=Bacillus thuringiensis TaxID=1428 RepID=UPI000BFB967E|nr:hypothetical protein [Bacillus thuringiensis]PGT89951.1 hypothetical protein COD17_09380 [Bacillus thuringiensis]